MKKSDLIQSKRICLMLEDDVDKKLRSLQAKLIQKKVGSCSFSQAINHALRIALKGK